MPVHHRTQTCSKRPADCHHHSCDMAAARAAVAVLAALSGASTPHASLSAGRAQYCGCWATAAQRIDGSSEHRPVPQLSVATAARGCSAAVEQRAIGCHRVQVTQHGRLRGLDTADSRRRSQQRGGARCAKASAAPRARAELSRPPAPPCFSGDSRKLIITSTCRGRMLYVRVYLPTARAPKRSLLTP